jgi:CheY-like chemotaxis protein
MSHELRTPLHSLLILARLLAQNPSRNLTVKQVEYANVIHSAGSDLLQLINDILDLSKVEAGRMDVRVERFTLEALIEDLQATFQPLTTEKGLEFEVSVEPSAPAELATDRQRLRQVLGNLLSNAVKFTERGRVTLRVTAARPDQEEAAAQAGVLFSVTDTGIGIAPENLAAIFGAFQQGDGTLSRRYGGTGLGLSIASEVGALLGGRITATSDLGTGSTFTLFLPDSPPESILAEWTLAESGPDAAAATALTPDGLVRLSAADGLAASVPSARFAGPDRNVLVIEGSGGGLLTLLAHSAISDLAEISPTARVSTATSPAQGIAMLAAEPFRCVVVDLGLPTAVEFLEQVHEKAELREIPVLAHATGQRDSAAVTGLAVLRSGYPTLELLPSLDELRERIALHLSAAQPGLVPALVSEEAPPAATAAAGEAAGAGHPSLEGKHVLVIDDDARNVFAIASTLELYGVRVTRATDGRRGIDALRAEPETDLILMDVMMPGMDGYTTMTAIRAMPEFERLPIIAVTARAMPGDREKSLVAGANDYITKPVDTDELLGRMERWLSAS